MNSDANRKTSVLGGTMLMKNIFILFAFLVATPRAMAGGIEVSGAQFQKDQNLSYYFGRVAVHSLRAATFKISNTADAPIDIEKLTISGAMFRANTNCPRRIEAKEVCYVRVYFQPYWEGYFVGDLRMNFSDKNNINIALSGSGSPF